MDVRQRVEAVREKMLAKGLSAYIVPSTDPHLSEYVPDRWQRRAWISGFTGSAGDVVVTRDGAGLWTDGRYYLQAATELRGSGITLFKVGTPGVPSVEDYLAEVTERGDLVGCDPRVLSVQRAGNLESALTRKGAKLRMPSANLVDAVWKGQPRLPRSPVRVHAQRFAGETIASKLRRVRRTMREVGADAHVLSALDAIMWVLNLRGRDVDYNPVAICYLVIEADSATLFVDPRQVDDGVRKHLGKHCAIRPYRDTGKALRDLAGRAKKVWVDAGDASRWVFDRLKGCDLHESMSCVTPMKARKNEVEAEGMRQAHLRDGVAMVRFLHWLEGSIRTEPITELSAAAKLEAFRAEGEHFQGLSFNTISGYADHGAIIHYAADERSDVPLRPKGIFLLDSGAQYLDGTTDITRTLLLGGRATAEQKERFTRVLMGNIELSSAVFPVGTRGLRLDTLARMHLWQAGLDYMHGTGHGVGAHLNVHEGPQSIGPRCTGAALEAGNVLSNEPGFYADGEYGIRVENLELVVESSKRSPAGIPFLEFETLTLCPIDTRLVKASLLGDAHRKWLNGYHRRVQGALTPHLDAAERRWLKQACRPV